MTERTKPEAEDLSPEAAQAEFQALTGIDPKAHREIEKQYDVEAGRAALEEAMKKLPKE